MNIETNVVIWQNSGPSGAFSVHVLNVDGTNTFTYNATSSDIFIQIRQAGTYYLDNIRMYRTYEDTVFVSGYEVDMAYRYGYNTQERVDEISGKGNHYTAEFWEYSPRLGRRWNIDPVYKQHLSNYSVLSGNPIMMVDPNGDDDGEYKTPDGKVFGKDGVDDGLEHIISEENFRNTISYALSPEVNKRNLSDFVINTRSNISGTKASNLSVTGSSIAVNSGFDNSKTNLEDIVINTGTGLGTLSGLFGGNYGLTSNQNFRYGEGGKSALSLSKTHTIQSLKVAKILGRVNVITSVFGTGASINYIVSDYQNGG